MDEKLFNKIGDELDALNPNFFRVCTIGDLESNIRYLGYSETETQAWIDEKDRLEAIYDAS